MNIPIIRTRVISRKVKVSGCINARGNKKGIAIRFCQKVRDTLSYFLKVFELYT